MRVYMKPIANFVWLKNMFAIKLDCKQIRQNTNDDWPIVAILNVIIFRLF